MRTYLYGIVLERNAHLVPAHIAGVGGATLHVVPCDRVSALVSSIDRSPNSHSLDDLRAHDHAIQAVVHHGATATAVRFGQTFRDDDEVRRHVTDRAATLAGPLEEFDGCVEMRLLLAADSSRLAGALDEPQAAGRQPVGPGHAYLESLRPNRLVSGLALRPALGPVVRAERVEELPQARGAAFAHLIRREDEPAYREAVSGQPSLAEATLVGPLAFYAFAQPAEPAEPPE